MELRDLYAKVGSTNATLFAIFFVTCAFLAALIPPFQSPDEFDHVKRAYLLAKGKIVLDHPEGHSSGGMIDSGLLSYESNYDGLIAKPNRRLTNETIQAADAVQWTGTTVFSAAPGVGFYFPIIYTPQAIGLLTGETLGFTVDTSYRLARFFAFLAAGLVIVAAFSIYPANPVVLALLILPMSLFQFASASLDGISTALTIFSVAAFMRIAADGPKAPPQLFSCLVASVLLLATSRVHLLPLILLILISCFKMEMKRGYLIFSISAAVVAAWLLVAIKSTVDLRVDLGTPTSQIILFYLKNPLAFLDVVLATLSDDYRVHEYGKSFIGVLGALDTRFSAENYDVIGWATGLIAILSISVANIKADWRDRSLLVGIAIVSIVMVFFALLVTWCIHPAQFIRGVQGRYFTTPLVVLAYAMSGGVSIRHCAFRKVALGLVGAQFLYVVPVMTGVLLERYYLPPRKPPKFIFVSSVADQGVQAGDMKFSRPLMFHRKA